MTYAAMILSDMRFWVCLGVLLAVGVVAYRLGWKAGESYAREDTQDASFKRGYLKGHADASVGWSYQEGYKDGCDATLSGYRRGKPDEDPK